MKKLTIATVMLAGAGAVQGQITITSLDMFNEAGQYYRSYAADQEVSVTGLIGAKGGPQTWNFAAGPEDAILRFDYLTPEDAGPPAALFPDAKLVERKRVEATGKDAFLFLDQQVGTGRMNYGYYDEATAGPVGVDDPAGVFDPPLLDFPESITFESSWSAGTVWFNSMLGSAMRINYLSTATVDAYGFVILPNLGFLECLRVNELVETTYAIQFPGSDPNDPTSGEFTPVATYYLRNLYWLAKDRGIVVQMTSKQGSTPPPDEFPTAGQFVRMFETNHPKTSQEPQPVEDLTVTPGEGQKILLSWTKPLNANSFRVEYSSALGAGADWQELTTTTGKFVLDDLRGNERGRYYRVVSLP